MSFLSAIIDEVNAYLQGNIAEDELEDWIVGHLQVVLDSGDKEAIHIANEVDASFVELEESIINRTTLRTRLAELTLRHNSV